MQATLTAFVVGAGAQRHARLEEETSLEWPRAQTARLLFPWLRVRAGRVGRPSRSVEWRERLGQLIDAMDRSVGELGPDPQAWWGRGQPMQLTMAADAEHGAVQKGIASAAAEPAGDEPATAVVLAMQLATVLVTTSQLSLAQSGARRTCRLR